MAGAAALSGVTTDWFGLYGNPTVNPGTDGERVIPSFCELCFWKCGILAHVKDGRVTKIKGEPEGPPFPGASLPEGRRRDGDPL